MPIGFGIMADIGPYAVTPLGPAVGTTDKIVTIQQIKYA